MSSSTSPSVLEAPWEAVSDACNVYINVFAGDADAWVAHRVMQIREALPSAGKDWYVGGSVGGGGGVDVVAGAGTWVSGE